MKRLTTLDSDGWELDDVELLSAENPSTFNIPDLPERSSLEPGQQAKLVFLFLTHENGAEIVDGERMWVRVKGRDGSGYRGVLESHPVTSKLVESGDEIYFEPRHVASTIIPYTDPRHPDYAPTSFGRFLNRIRRSLGVPKF